MGHQHLIRQEDTLFCICCLLPVLNLSSYTLVPMVLVIFADLLKPASITSTFGDKAGVREEVKGGEHNTRTQDLEKDAETGGNRKDRESREISTYVKTSSDCAFIALFKEHYGHWRTHRRFR